MTKEQFFNGISKPRNPILMRMFLNIGLTEHTRHGIPTIVEKYGKDVSEIKSNYIKGSKETIYKLIITIRFTWKFE